MYELIQVGEKSYYIDCPAKIGIYAQSEKEVYLIDSGNDKETAKKTLKIIAEKNWIVKGIINTHSHADHTGGNAYIQSKTGCPVFCNGIEADFTRHPILEPALIFGGYPCKPLRNKFLMAKESVVTDFSSPEFPHEVEVIPLPGHFFDMAGFRTPDNTVFLADCICSAEVLEKYGIPFIYDVEKYLATLEMLPSIQAEVFVPSHIDPCKDISKLAEINRDKVFEIERLIKDICATPVTTDEIITALFRHYGLTMTLSQYALVGFTIRSFLSWLTDKRKISYMAEDAKLLWKKT